MSCNHTVAPWDVEIRIERGITTYLLGTTQGGESDEEADGNRRLMNAAPALLALAESVIILYQHRHQWPLEEMWDRFATVAIDAQRAIAQTEDRELGFRAAAAELGISARDVRDVVPEASDTESSTERPDAIQTLERARQLLRDRGWVPRSPGGNALFGAETGSLTVLNALWQAATFGEGLVAPEAAGTAGDLLCRTLWPDSPGAEMVHLGEWCRRPGRTPEEVDALFTEALKGARRMLAEAVFGPENPEPAVADPRPTEG